MEKEHGLDLLNELHGVLAVTAQEEALDAKFEKG